VAAISSIERVTSATTPPTTAPADRVLWREQVDLGDLPASAPVAGRRVDVVVVGGGFAAMAAAHRLAAAGRSVLVLEKGDLGSGAHARNGGMAIPELKAGPAALEAAYGPLGRRMHQDVNDAFDFLEALIDDEAIDCDYVRSGQLYLAHRPREADHLRAVAAEHAEAGEPVRFVEREALGTEIGSDAFFGAVVFDRTGGLHPAKLHAGLARRAVAAGAELAERCAARTFHDRGAGARGGRFEVRTTAGTVHADHLLLTTNADADGVAPELARRVLPIGSFIVATEPLDAEVAASISPRGRMFVDTKNLLFYWRLTPDRRVVFGGRRSLSPVTVAEAADHLTASLRRIHPQVASTAITHRWGGNVAMTLDRMPHVGQVRGAWYATGCNGSGVALNTWMGDRLGAMVLGDAAPPSFAQLRHRPIPMHRLRRWYLPTVGRWFQYQDRR
jgi:glycine/D-amino acid oxidase-like deaminating enzyme